MSEPTCRCSSSEALTDEACPKCQKQYAEKRLTEAKPKIEGPQILTESR